MRVCFTKPFVYWHDGYRREMYAIGEQDVTDEVAASALACGYAASAKKLKDETPETEAPATEKVPSAKREKRK